ncbi:hypothetical protein QFC20_000755 [Naganishia adeliensis]|uniref:Uncharacterized protein n=1 Tax=Naganishia adeliensis TaxID=92952 RepID=A0ACC2WYH0_9TREE|nr:hypothetical protein QFC20_000755 [Naganishia adeliensis]
MARDLGRFMSEHSLTKGVNLIGHSMGGKAVMAFALNDAFNGCLRTLISADMAPSIGKISPEFAAYAKGMQEIEEAKVRTKSEGDKVLQAYEKAALTVLPSKSLPTRQFLLTNAITAPDKTVKFRIPLDIIHESIPSIGEFPYQPGEVSWSGPTLFIKGEHSNYINRRNIPVCKEFFPSMELETLDAGHWVHAERPMEFVDLVDKFVRKAE